MRTLPFTVRRYVASDETAWLRCRAIAFLDTAYFDDVHNSKPDVSPPGFELVAVGAAGEVIGLLDVSVEGEEATIDTVAVHPDHRRFGIGRALLHEAIDRLRALNVTMLDAWTRDDPATLRWYRSNGFDESDHYLHVYADYYVDADEPDRAIGQRRSGMRPIKVFLHAKSVDEADMRRQFARVHVCRRFSRGIRAVS